MFARRIDAIAEIKIQTNLYAADVGRTAGGVINIITKSGSNNLHGSLYEFFRNDKLDARNFFAPPGATPKFRQNQFSGSVGGAIIKNRTFFFGDVESLKVVQGVVATVTVPTAFQANIGNFSDVNGPTVPLNRIDPIGAKYFALYPLPNRPGVANNFSSARNRTFDGLTADARIDHRFSDRNSLFGRYSINRNDVDTPGILPAVNGIEPGGNILTFAGTSKIRANAVQLNAVHVLRPNLILELKAGFTRVDIRSLPLNNGKNLSRQFGLPNVNLDDASSGLAPMFFSGAYASVGDGVFVPLTYLDNTFQYQGAVSYTRGAHNIRAGAAGIRRQATYGQSSFPIGLFVFLPIAPTNNALANLLFGQPIQTQRSNFLVTPSYRIWGPSFFVQDDWRVTKWLTLQLLFQRRYKTGLTLNTNYTYARGIDNFPAPGGTTYPYALLPDSVNTYDRGNGDLDIRHRWVFTANYELPFGKSLKGWQAALAKGWQLNSIASYQTGLPFSIVSSNARINLGPTVTTDRPDRLRNGSLSNPTVERYFDTTAFASQALGTAGSSGRNILYGPNQRRVDLSVFKEFQIHESLRLQFRAESYNLTNTASFSNPNATLGSPSIGQIASTPSNAPPRQHQFALKLLF